MKDKLEKLKELYTEFNIYDVNNVIVIISFIIFLLSIYNVINIYLIIILYLYILYFARNYEKNMIKFVSFLLPIILLGYLLIHFVNLKIIGVETFKIFRIVIKILMFLDCIFILYNYFKIKKIKLQNLLKRKYKKYTFKELKRINNDKFRNDYNSYLDDYLEKNKISLDSDYFKVIENNIDNKINDNLNEYIWTNYLRFYKNQKYNYKKYFNVSNLVFLIINVIILLLVLFVR